VCGVVYWVRLLVVMWCGVVVSVAWFLQRERVGRGVLVSIRGPGGKCRRKIFRDRYLFGEYRVSLFDEGDRVLIHAIVQACGKMREGCKGEVLRVSIEICGESAVVEADGKIHECDLL
jgi:hypothetical protein